MSWWLFACQDNTLSRPRGPHKRLSNAGVTLGSMRGGLSSCTRIPAAVMTTEKLERAPSMLFVPKHWASWLHFETSRTSSEPLWESLRPVESLVWPLQDPSIAVRRATRQVETEPHHDHVQGPRAVPLVSHICEAAAVDGSLRYYERQQEDIAKTCTTARRNCQTTMVGERG